MPTRLVIISGRSGSGKSTALNVLEDSGYYCIDNLPVGLLPALVERAKNKQQENDYLAVCIDARNHTDEIDAFTRIMQSLPADVQTQIIYMDASSPVLIKRFSETRRKHPLSNNQISLREAIRKEKQLLAPIAAIADLQINTNQMNVHSLRDMIRKRVCGHLHDGSMSILFTSFGFKSGIPVDADMVYDVRCLPNPYWDLNLRKKSGQDGEVKAFLQQQDDVVKMLADIRSYLEYWLPRFNAGNRSYVTIAIGCTGGMHRSVFIAEQLKDYFSRLYPSVLIDHRDLHDH
ncbi:MAG TPA: RNase adapter RapZ [Pseudomonadales bacterium]